MWCPAVLCASVNPALGARVSAAGGQWTGLCQRTHLALAFVVPRQEGGSVLLQPHGSSVACVLPATEKIAQRQRVGRVHVRFCILEVSACHFLSS